MKRDLWSVSGILAAILFLLSACSSTLLPLDDQALRQKAQAGSGEAQYQLALRLEAVPDYPQAMHWMKKVTDSANSQPASQAHRASAARQVADWYHKGLGETRNEPLALIWWKKAAALGDTEASYHLGQHCRTEHKGKLVAECINWYKTAAKQHHTDAQLALGQWYTQHGQYQDSILWLEKAASQGNAEAQYLLAKHYGQGHGTAKNPAKAEELYAQSAEQNYPAAVTWMATHSSGKEALRWYQQAAQAGDASAQLWLGLAYLNGTGGVSAQTDTAKQWLLKALNNGSAQAGYEYSRLQTDDSLREYYLQQSAERGYVPALRQMAQRAASEEDYLQARQLWQHLADKKDPQAQLMLGDYMREGLGGRLDLPAAVRSYRQAAQSGLHQAQYRMGIMYQSGLGTARNRVYAYAWYSLAAVTDAVNSMQALNDLERTLTPQEIRQAQQLALKWQQQIRQKQQQNNDRENRNE